MLFISKGFLPIVRDSHELFVFIRKAFPSIVREDIQPTTRPRINISQVPAGWAVFVACLLFSMVFCFVCVSTMSFAYTCKNSKRLTRQKHQKTKEKQDKQEKQQQNLREKHKTTKNTAHPAGTWEIFIRGRVVGWRMSCICVFLEGLFVLFGCSFVFA